jgi:glycosyltransferase involved in cell wall biosynthesis
MPEIRYSIIITCYDQEKFIRAAVESALLQTCIGREIIAVDDGSHDRSLMILKQYEPAITLIHLETNHGAAEARNRGAALAAGEYLLFLDGDDVLTHDALEIYQRLITERSPIAIVSGALWFSGPVPRAQRDLPKRIEFFEYRSLMAKDRPSGIYNGAFVIKRLTFQQVGGWSPELFHLDGQDLYIKLAYSGRAILIQSPHTMLYRMHAGNSIHSVSAYVTAVHIMISREYAGVYPGGPPKRFERYGRHGGVILFCVKRTLHARLYTDAARLVISGWPMILAAISRRIMVCIRGRERMQVIEMNVTEGGPSMMATTDHSNAERTDALQ